MDLPGKSSACSNSVDGKLEGTRGLQAGEDQCADKQNYWQLYREKYNRLGITTKGTTSDNDTVPKMTFRDYPGVTSVQTHADTVGLGSRSHCVYSERRRSRGGTVQLPLPNSNLRSYSSEACDDYQLDTVSTPAISHSLSSADFRDIQRAERGRLGGGNPRFGSGDDDAMTSTPRTSSLLNDPMLRKHLARAMGVDASSHALEGEINRRVGSVHVGLALIDNKPAELVGNDTDAGAVSQQVELSVVLSKDVDIGRETECMVPEDLTVEPHRNVKTDCGFDAEGASSNICERRRTLRRTLSCMRTRSTQIIGPTREVGVCWTDVTQQSVETTASETPAILQKHVMSPSQEPSSSDMLHLWHSAAKDTSQNVDGITSFESHGNGRKSSSKKAHTSSGSVGHGSPVMPKRQLGLHGVLPRRTNSVNTPPTATNTGIRAGFHLPSFREFKQSRKHKSTPEDVTSDCVVNTTVPESGTTESGTTESGTTESGTTESGTTESGGVSSDVVLKEKEDVNCTVNSVEKQVEATKRIHKARLRKRSVKIGDESLCAQSDKQLMFRTQKTTCARDETSVVLSPETPLDTTAICVVSTVSVSSVSTVSVSPVSVSSVSVSPVSGSNEHGDNNEITKEAQKPQTPVEPCPAALNTPIAPPRRNRKLKVQLKVSTDAEPSGVRDSVCVDCIAARKSSATSPRDETFTSSRCRLHRSKGSLPEGATKELAVKKKGDESSRWTSLSEVTATTEQLDSQNAVIRSVSDVTDLNAEEKRRKSVRRRRPKPYKSDPFYNSTKLEGDKSNERVALGQRLGRGDTEGLEASTRDDIVEFLQKQTSAPSGGLRESDKLGQAAAHRKRHKVRRSLERSCSRKEDERSETGVKRTDSGVCFEADEHLRESQDLGPDCEDCGKRLEDDDIPGGLPWEEVFVCRKCNSRCVERKETIQEIVDTEISYGKHLRIIKGEFYEPMKTASLLNADQLQAIFSNLDELIEVNNRFADILQDALELANEQGDEDYATVSIGQLFLDSSTMLLAYETYCVNQSGVAPYLEQLESNKELLRVFLSVSQTENSVLRRMSFKSFLMVPVQRIMRYPLLLERVYKATPLQHQDREYIKKAEEKIEAILMHINRKSKNPMGSALLRMSKRRFGGSSSSFRSISTENIEVNKIIVDMLPWDRSEVNFVLTGRMLYCQQQEQLWGKKGRTLKLLPIYCVLVTRGKSMPVTPADETGAMSSRPTTVQHAALILVKEKWFKCTPLRDPIYLDKCVVSLDDEFRLIEVLDIASNESYAIKGENQESTVKWLDQLKKYSTTLGIWRHRRNALPNIMVQNLSKFQELAAADLYD